MERNKSVMPSGIEIPAEFADLIESAKKARSGQTRKYGPYEEEFVVMLKSDYDDKDRERILAFCQERCHKCRYTEQELCEIKGRRDMPFEEVMAAIAEGSYTLIANVSWGKKVIYKWSQDYLD